MVRYTDHYLINYLSDGDLTGPLSVEKLSTWHGETLHCRDATPHHLRKTIPFFFPCKPLMTCTKLNQPYVIPHT